MTSSMLRGVRRSLGLLAAGTILGAGGTAAAAQAQANLPPGAVVQPLPAPDSGAELRRHLADLGANPRSLTSLIGAGRAAIAVGDGNAAIGFFGRAEEIAPRDARVKAGMASAFVLLEQPQAALRFFAEAAQLGAPEHEIARDRGLAHDMTGNPRRAQQDYMVVLTRGEDAETRRRLALSLAISGHREAAIRTLDPLIQRRDRPAFRTRAFVLALTGDAAGAQQAADASMPGQGQAMAPFLGRLAGLNPAQKAMAVHFGHFPADGRPVQMAQGIDTSALPAAVAMSGARQTPAAAPAPAGRATAPAATVANRNVQTASTGVRRRVVPEPVPSREPRRTGVNEIELDRFGRPVRDTRTAAPARTATAQPQQQTRTAAATPVRTPAATQPQQQPRTAAPQPVRTPAAAQPQQARPTVPAPVRQQPTVVASNDVQMSSGLSTGGPAAPATQPGFTAAPAPAPAPAMQPVQIAAAQPGDIPPAMRMDGPPPTPAARAEPPVQQQRQPAAAAPAPQPAAVEPARVDFSDIAELVQSLPEERPAATPARTTPAPAAARTPARAAPAPARTAAATPARPGTTTTRTPAAGTRTAAATPAPARARTPAAPAHPSRHWVQIANGSPGGLAFELGRIRRAAPELMQGRTAWSAANGASGRLLVGPFASNAEARTFVNQLARKDVPSFAWQSEAGEEVARLPAR